MHELTPTQMAAIERVLANGFTPTMIPLYPNCVVIRRNEYAVLLTGTDSGGWRFFGDPCYLMENNLGVLVRQGERQWFVWKTKKVEATPALLAERKRFSDELLRLLDPSPHPV